MAESRLSSEQRRRELTDAALRVIATRGVSALSTRALADEVGLSTGAIFRHFASIDALLDAVVARVEELIEATYPPEGLAPVERLERFVEARSAAVGQQLGILRLLLSEQFLLALPSRGAERLTGCIERSRAYVRECLREGQSRGEVRDDLSAESLAPIVLGTIQMLALAPVRSKRRAPASSATREALFALLRPPVARAAKRARRAEVEG